MTNCTSLTQEVEDLTKRIEALEEAAKPRQAQEGETIQAQCPTSGIWHDVSRLEEMDELGQMLTDWRAWIRRDTRQEDEPRQAREGWQVFRDIPLCKDDWVDETWAEEHENQYPDWRTWPAKRVAREGYEVQHPKTKRWYRELNIDDKGWEHWESRPIEDPEPGPSDPPPAVGDENEITFYRSRELPYGFFSNLFKRPILFEGQEFPTSEHAYQFAKPRRQEVREWLMAAPSPALLAMTAHTLDDRPKERVLGWKDIKVDRMRAVVLAKFQQHSDLAATLENTGSLRIVEVTPKDTFWGEADGVGQNWLGKILMETRAKLRAPSPPAAGPGLRETVETFLSRYDARKIVCVDILRSALTRADEDARLVEAVMKWGYISCDSHGTTHAQRGLRTALDELKAAREEAEV